MGRRGLIDRRGDENDRTVIVATLTEDGVEITEVARRLLRKTLEDAMHNGITSADLKDAEGVLRRLADGLSA
jgi:DNA-binding MarR family transcriptional regulator